MDLQQKIRQIPAYTTLLENINRGAVQLSGLNRAAKPFFAAQILKDTQKQGLYICESDYTAQRLCGFFRAFLENSVFFYPAKEIEFVKTDAGSHEVQNMRLNTLENLANVMGQCGITVMSVDALLQFTVDLQAYRTNTLHIACGMETSPETLIEKLDALGYRRVDMVEGQGQFSARGGIVDLFVPNGEYPYRIEFFGDEVDSVRMFDVFTQISVENITNITVGPADENFMHQNAETCVLEYFAKDAVVFFDEYKTVKERADGLAWDIEETVKALAEKVPEFVFRERYVHPFYDVLGELLKHPLVELCDLPHSSEDISYCMRAEIVCGETRKTLVRREDFYDELRDLFQNGYRAYLYADRERTEQLNEDLSAQGFLQSAQGAAGKYTFVPAVLPEGFSVETAKIVFFGETEIFGKTTRRTKKGKKADAATRIRDFNELEVGDCVVHRTHGIGKYMGLETLEVDGMRRDYLKVVYQAGDTLYVPTEQLDLLQKYVGNSEQIPLNKLGGKDFAKQKNKVKESTRDLAKELVRLYAARQQAKGFAFSADSDWQKNFEAGFPYEETDDQLQSIEEVKRDMESTRPMDRLLCGDVGYGKTEVALRAAFKAVMDSKQVAYLAPTTVLAMQQFQTFLRRMKAYPIRIAELSRLKTAKEQKEVLKKLKSGEVDIVIGTHRLLAKDVVFHDLGLLIVDEEQRFGVTHKERIKTMKNNVDVLTLSATPIPRTLHMSMLNIRDMSVLAEPPENRFPVRTIVMEHNDDVLANAIKRELSRGGQVYYIYNRISGIERKAAKLQEMFPDAQIAVGHGSMDKNQLEDIMLGMSQGEIQILVCTTIIETGMDIPNVNTIIIEDANRMGLSQLYQLKGRVGRTSKRAFAYFTYRPDRVLNETAQKRLKAIKEFTEFGSGFKIAMRDLEIRGAGNLLGAQQHGHIDAIGYDLYCEILENSVRELTGEPPREDWQPTVDIGVEAYIPPRYIKNHSMRLDIYKKIATMESPEDKSDMIDELCDRFGEMPTAVCALINVSEIRYLAKSAGVQEVIIKDGRAQFFPKGEMNPKAVAGLAGIYRGNFFATGGQRPSMLLKCPVKPKDNMPIVKKFLEEYNKLLHTEQI